MRSKSEVVYYDEDFIIVNKAAGVPTVADRHGKVENYLLKWLHQQFKEVFPIHRLDTNTSGLICFARTEDEQRRLSKIFEERSVVKKYYALVLGCPKIERGTIDAPILRLENKNQVIISPKGKQAISSYRIKETFKGFALLDIRLQTGRTHQVRVHLQHIGHPLLVDPTYGGQDMFFLSSIKKNFRGHRSLERPLLERTPLHAYFLSFANRRGMEVHFESELPKDISAVINQLRKI